MGVGVEVLCWRHLRAFAGDAVGLWHQNFIMPRPFTIQCYQFETHRTGQEQITEQIQSVDIIGAQTDLQVRVL